MLCCGPRRKCTRSRSAQPLLRDLDRCHRSQESNIRCHPPLHFTFHRAQGMTLTAVVLDTACFTRSKGRRVFQAFYVGLTRVRSIQDLFVTEEFPASVKSILPPSDVVKESERLRTLERRTKQRVSKFIEDLEQHRNSLAFRSASRQVRERSPMIFLNVPEDGIRGKAASSAFTAFNQSAWIDLG